MNRVEPAVPSTFEAIYGALFRPKATFLGQAPPMRAGMLVLVVFGIITALNASHGKPGLVVLALVTSLGWLFWSWLVVSIGLYLVSRALYKRGEFKRLGAAVALAYTPWLLAGPSQVLQGLGKGGFGASMILILLIALWALRLLVLGVRGAVNLTPRQSVWALVAMELLAVALPTAWLLLSGLTLCLAAMQAI